MVFCPPLPPILDGSESIRAVFANNGIAGGGYISPATPGHLKYQFALQKYLRKQGIDISFFSLSYILAPKCIYPVQIQSALSALKYLVEKENRDPSTILLGGDSAGGNLVAALLLHLGHAHPLVPPFPLAKKLKAALLISPWVSFETQSPSFRTNEMSDYLTVTAVRRASTAFIGPEKQHDEYSEPINAPVQWWRKVADKAVENVLVWGGGGEVLIDGITAFAGHIISGFHDAEIAHTRVDEKLEEDATSKAAGVFAMMKNGSNGWRERATLIVSPHEAHEEMIIDYVLSIRKKEDGAKAIEKWLTNTLRETPEKSQIVT